LPGGDKNKMMNSNTKMTAQELEQMIAQMEKIFTVVRILDKDLLHKMDVRNGELRSEDCKCYSFWEKGKNCENCVAQRALAMKGQCTKLEFIGLKMYQVIAKYLEVDNLAPYRLFSGLRHMEKIFLDSKSQYDSSATFIWTPDKINAHFVIGFVSFTLMRMLQAKLDFQFSMEQIGISLQRYNCVQIAGNIYQFTYYDVILDACEKALELELHNKYRSQLQIRRLLRY